MVRVGIAAAIAFVLSTAIYLVVARDPDLENQERAGRDYMTQLDKASGLRKNRAGIASWNYDSNITDANKNTYLSVSLEVAKQTKEAWQETVTYPWRDYQDYDLKRMFEKYSKLGRAALSDENYEKLANIITDMSTNYAKAKICAYNNPTKCDLGIEPEVTEIFSTSQNPEELKHTWVEWHKAAGARVKGNFTEYVELVNEEARLNGAQDNADYWLQEYEKEDFEDDMARIWEQIKPLYQQIHAYVRRRLREKYGEEVVSSRGPIPAHLLGNLWAQTWGNVESYTRPYPDKPDIDVTAAMIAQGYTPLKMFQAADGFFKSINTTGMPELFWKNSIIEKPADGRDLVCHASAWDFYDGEDFRIKQCTEVNMEELQTAHHEMGHIEYYLQYKHQPQVFREGANPGFHEAVGDVIALSVTTPKHLRKIGLLNDEAEDEQTEINQLYRMGIEKIVFLPFGYLLDIYRYGIFRGETTPENYNCHFWNLREELQGLEPPVNRTEDDFDAAAKYHISADVEYARYYVSFVIQFQFHKALCEKAREYVPGDDTKKLVDCDIFESVEAGNALSAMLSMGSSRPWPDAMEVLTGQKEMSAGALFEYFQPLYDWLKSENQRTGEFIGWESSRTTYCTEEQAAELERSRQDKALKKKQSKDNDK